MGSSDPAIVAEAKVTLARLMDDSAEDLNPRLGQYVTKWTYKWTHTIDSHPILCAVYCVLRTAYCVLRTVYGVLCTVYGVRCTVYGELCFLTTICTPMMEICL